MSPLSQGEQLIERAGVDLCVETYGDRADPTIVLAAGASASMLWWHAELCERLAAAGRHVVRYDQRDTGRSTSWPPGQPAYSTTDLTLDVLGILDHLEIECAHLVCQSMAGGIGLIAGVDHPDRVATLTLVSTTTGESGLPPPSEGLATAMPAAPHSTDASAVVDHVVDASRACAGDSPYFDESTIRTLAERDVARARNYTSTLVNHYAMETGAPGRGGFEDIAAPTLVIHGDCDPLLPLAHGKALRDTIPGASLMVLEGAGHDLPKPVWPVFISAVLQHTGPGDR